jgi:hypothetical protein
MQFLPCTAFIYHNLLARDASISMYFYTSYLLFHSANGASMDKLLFDFSLCALIDVGN